MVCALGGDWVGELMTDGTRQMADFAREPSDSQIDGGLRIGSKRQAAGARRGGGEVVVVVYGGCRREQGANVKEVPQARPARVSHSSSPFSLGHRVTSLVGIKLGIRCGPSVRPSMPRPALHQALNQLDLLLAERG